MNCIAIIMLFAHQIRAQSSSLAKTEWKESPLPIWSTTDQSAVNFGAIAGYYNGEITLIGMFICFDLFYNE